MTTALPLWAEVGVAALLVVGAAFTLLGSWALAKLSTFVRRVHGPSKTTTLGVGCVLAASAIAHAAAGDWSLREALVVLFLFVTAPVSAQLLMQAAFRADASLRPPPPPPADDAAASPSPAAAPAADTGSQRPARRAAPAAPD